MIHPSARAVKRWFRSGNGQVLCWPGYKLIHWSYTVNATARSFLAVLISGALLWSVLNYSLLFRMPLWSFVLILGVLYLVIDVALQELQKRIGTR